MEFEMKPYEEKLDSAVDALNRDFAGIRSGRVSTKMVESIKVEAYGSEMPLNQVASISVPEARVILLQPFDKSTMTDIERAIQMADLGVNPNNDGHVIRLIFPALTEERRKEYVKMAKSRAEDAKVAVRNVRKDMLDAVKKLEDGAPEDEVKRLQDKVQKLIDSYANKIDDIFAKKEKEILEV